jgi:hypothetical protein
MPLRVRTDAGGENVLVWRCVREYHNRDSAVIIGSSVHNQRVERMWRDVNRLVSDQFRSEFYFLEQSGHLDADNDTDLFCLHFVFSQVINSVLEEFRLAHNNHSLRTERNSTPLQLFSTNQHLYQLQCETANTIADTPNIIPSSNPHVIITRTNIAHQLPDDLLDHLNILRSSVVDIVTARAIYIQVSNCIGDYVLSCAS